VKIYLHIGTEKTGTTSIQSFLADNRDMLRKNKIMYSKVLGDPNNIRLSVALQDTDKIDDSRIHSGIITEESILDFRKKLRDELREEIDNEKPEILIISSEHLSSRMDREDEIERIKLFLNEFSQDITIVVYLRRQDEFFESLYSTAIKKGHTIDFEFPKEGKERQDFHYDRMLRKWEKVFGMEHMIVRLFSKKKLYNNDVIADFIHTLKLTLPYEKTKTKKENISFGSKKLAFLKEFNQYVPEITNNKINPLRGNIEKLLESIAIEDKKVKMPSNKKNNFVQRFSSKNNQIASRYFPGEDRLFEDILIEEDEEINLEISKEDAIKIFAKIWMAKEKQVIEKIKHIKALEIELEIIQGDIDKGLLMAKNFLNKYPLHPDAFYLMALALSYDKNYKDASIYIEKAIEGNPLNEKFHKLKKELVYE